MVGSFLMAWVAIGGLIVLPVRILTVLTIDISIESKES